MHGFVGPEPRGEPGVEGVRGLHQPFSPGDSDLQAKFSGSVDLRATARRTVSPGRFRRLADAGYLSIPKPECGGPPDLARDAPVLDVLEPMLVGLGPVIRDEI